MEVCDGICYDTEYFDKCISLYTVECMALGV